MKVNLIAAGGALAATAVVAMASPADARPAECELTIGGQVHTLGSGGSGIYAAQHEVISCEEQYSDDSTSGYDDVSTDNGSSTGDPAGYSLGY
ncbi:hypothetical protein [Nonomuraea turcica]|uniref:hypothetical protein n=1 Tax=Nonomuraea sp. G32 TaxID=3067274 RepID=UPI00273A9E39|nr:hypothetical protein [Nonomuraea sp. G32]MDP4509951.1 hypothetical protein [Nonomuraea sp. G32]